MTTAGLGNAEPPADASLPPKTAPATPASNDEAKTPTRLEPFTVTVPASGYKLNFVPIPGDAGKGIDPFWMCTTETPWDAFDVYVFKLDEPEEDRGGSTGADAKTHPSKPYVPPDRGFGHANFAAISMTSKSAEGFCAWLSAKTGKAIRLATEDEWEHAALAGQSAGDEHAAQGGPDKLADSAWFKENSNAAPHAVATRKPNALGVYDLYGNVSEWVKGRDGKAVVKGGSYQDAAEGLKVSWRSPQQPAWNSSDPQVPKSRWWLPDAPFVGFRLVCEKPGTQEKPRTPEKPEAGK
jgi:sulfatase modifying factor 1